MKRIISILILVCFILTSVGPVPCAHADTVLGLPAVGTMVSLSSAYEPVMIKGLTVHKDNPFLFDFIVDVGQDRISGQPLKKEGEKLIKYFLASLAIPDKDVWVNLSPYEKNRMIPEALGQTDMGRDLLEQDYILKQITASLIYPEKQLGKTFWDTVYAKARQTYGTTDIPVNTFNKVWIMADRAEVFEHGQTAFVVKQHLKVMLEEDYLALTKHSAALPLAARNDSHSIGANIVKQIVLPGLEKEVNTGKNFANLRQIFNSIILSSWYKRNLKEALLNFVYTDRSKVKGIDLNDPTIKQQIYEQYLKAYKKGVFNYIKEDVDAAGSTIPRKYFSGGIDEAMAATPEITTDAAELASSLLPSAGRLFDFATLASMQPIKTNTLVSQMLERNEVSPVAGFYAHDTSRAKMLKSYYDKTLHPGEEISGTLGSLMSFYIGVPGGASTLEVYLNVDGTASVYSVYRDEDHFIGTASGRNVVVEHGLEIRVSANGESVQVENIFDMPVPYADSAMTSSFYYAIAGKDKEVRVLPSRKMRTNHVLGDLVLGTDSESRSTAQESLDVLKMLREVAESGVIGKNEINRMKARSAGLLVWGSESGSSKRKLQLDPDARFIINNSFNSYGEYVGMDAVEISVFEMRRPKLQKELVAINNKLVTSGEYDRVVSVLRKYQGNHNLLGYLGGMARGASVSIAASDKIRFDKLGIATGLLDNNGSWANDEIGAIVLAATRTKQTYEANLLKGYFREPIHVRLDVKTVRQALKADGAMTGEGERTGAKVLHFPDAEDIVNRMHDPVLTWDNLVNLAIELLDDGAKGALDYENGPTFTFKGRKILGSSGELVKFKDGGIYEHTLPQEQVEDSRHIYLVASPGLYLQLTLSEFMMNMALQLQADPVKANQIFFDLYSQIDGLPEGTIEQYAKVILKEIGDTGITEESLSSLAQKLLKEKAKKAINYNVALPTFPGKTYYGLEEPLLSSEQGLHIAGTVRYRLPSDAFKDNEHIYLMARAGHYLAFTPAEFMLNMALQLQANPEVARGIYKNIDRQLPADLAMAAEIRDANFGKKTAYRRVMSVNRARIVFPKGEIRIERQSPMKYFIESSNTLLGPVRIENSTGMYGFIFGMDHGAFVLNVDEEKRMVPVELDIGAKTYKADAEEPQSIKVSNGNIIRIRFAGQEMILRYRNGRLLVQEPFELNSSDFIVFKGENGNDIFRVAGQNSDAVGVIDTSAGQTQLFYEPLLEQSDQLVSYLDDFHSGDLFWYHQFSDRVEALKRLDNLSHGNYYWRALSDLNLKLRQLGLSEKTLLPFEQALISAAHNVNNKDRRDSPDLYFFALIEKALVLSRILEFLSGQISEGDLSEAIPINISPKIKEVKIDDEVIKAAKELRSRMGPNIDKMFIINKLFEAAFVQNLELSRLFVNFIVIMHEGWGGPVRHFSQNDLSDFKMFLGVDPVRAADEVSVGEFKKMVRERKITNEGQRIIDLKLKPEEGAQGPQAHQDITGVTFQGMTTDGDILYSPQDSMPGVQPVSLSIKKILSIVIHPDAAMTGELNDKARLQLILIRLIPPDRLRFIANSLYPEGTRIGKTNISNIIRLHSMTDSIPQKLNTYDEKQLNAFCVFIMDRYPNEFTSLFNRALAEDFLLYSRGKGLRVKGEEELRQKIKEWFVGLTWAGNEQPGAAPGLVFPGFIKLGPANKEGLSTVEAVNKAMTAYCAIEGKDGGRLILKDKVDEIMDILHRLFKDKYYDPSNLFRHKADLSQEIDARIEKEAIEAGFWDKERKFFDRDVQLILEGLYWTGNSWSPEKVEIPVSEMARQKSQEHLAAIVKGESGVLVPLDLLLHVVEVLKKKHNDPLLLFDLKEAAYEGKPLVKPDFIRAGQAMGLLNPDGSFISEDVADIVNAATDYDALFPSEAEFVQPGYVELSGGAVRDTLDISSLAESPGGIDLNTSNGMQWKISKDGRGVEMNIDPAIIQRVRREGIDSLSPVILRMTPVDNIWSLVGLSVPA